MDLNILAIAVATVVAFVIGAVWYGALAGRMAGLHEAYAEPASPSPATIAGELARCLLLAVTVAWLAGEIAPDGVGESLLMGVVLWVGFPAVLLSGSVLHERVPPPLAAIHAGDWLLKLLALALILGLWR